MECWAFFPLNLLFPAKVNVHRRPKISPALRTSWVLFILSFEIENEGANVEFPSRPVRKSSPPRTLLTLLPPARLTFITLIGKSRPPPPPPLKVDPSGCCWKASFLDLCRPDAAQKTAGSVLIDWERRCCRRSSATGLIALLQRKIPLIPRSHVSKHRAGALNTPREPA